MILTAQDLYYPQNSPRGMSVRFSVSRTSGTSNILALPCQLSLQLYFASINKSSVGVDKGTLAAAVPKDLYSPHHKNKEKRECTCDAIFWRVRINIFTRGRKRYVTLYCCWPTNNCQQHNTVQHRHGKATMCSICSLSELQNITYYFQWYKSI